MKRPPVRAAAGAPAAIRYSNRVPIGQLGKGGDCNDD